MFCPGVFKTPLLKGVKVEDEMPWKGDLDKPIEFLFSTKVQNTYSDAYYFIEFTILFFFWPK